MAGTSIDQESIGTDLQTGMTRQLQTGSVILGIQKRAPGKAERIGFFAAKSHSATEGVWENNMQDVGVTQTPALDIRKTDTAHDDNTASV